VGEHAFDVAAFYARVGASVKERNALRQDLVRGLKDYYEAAYGYDRYGAETIFMVPERMSEPYVYGFALLRIIHDRRLSVEVRSAAAEFAIESVAYGQDQGLPYAFFAALDFLAANHALKTEEFRYALVASAGEYNPFRGLDKAGCVRLFKALLGADMEPAERLFWGHSLIARHQDQPGTPDFINLLLGDDRFAVEQRVELSRSWIHFRQPHIPVDLPEPGPSFGETFVAEHMPFWVAHAPSWPTATMVRLGLVWLARLGEDALALGEAYIDYRNTYADQVQAGVAEILFEHRANIATDRLRALIERGATAGSISTRRKFYRLGADVFGPSYLERATEDAAGSVRQWALRQLQKQS
jgi:hypothetical protein